MKIYILRHEDRTEDCSFYSPLTKTGLENATELVEKLEDHKINIIYSSPFIRTLQTIYPYSKESKNLINLEYGLSEIHNEDIIPKKAVGMSLPEYLAQAFCYNPEYKSLIKPTEILYPERENNVMVRVKRVLRDIIAKNYDTDNNIIIVTHQSLCFAILKIVNKRSPTMKGKLDEGLFINYPKGKLSLVFDKEWTYKPIN